MSQSEFRGIQNMSFGTLILWISLVCAVISCTAALIARKTGGWPLRH
jgi:hypothetical protein